MNLTSKVFVVTGAGNGIGRAVALELVSKGALVAGIDIRQSDLEQTAALAQSESFTAHVTDITDRAAVERAAEEIITAHGHIDGVAHIAGVIQRFVNVIELSPQEIDRVVNINFWGTVHVNQVFLPYLLARKEASLLNVSSMGGLVPVPGQGAYGASKAAVKLWTECLFAELQGTSVAVTEVFPGAVGTHITENSGVEAPKVPEGATPKMTSPQEAARLMVEALENGTPRLLIGSDAKSLDRLSRLAPTKAITIVAKKMKDLLG